MLQLCFNLQHCLQSWRYNSLFLLWINSKEQTHIDQSQGPSSFWYSQCLCLSIPPSQKNLLPFVSWSWIQYPLDPLPYDNSHHWITSISELWCLALFIFNRCVCGEWYLRQKEKLSGWSLLSVSEGTQEARRLNQSERGQSGGNDLRLVLGYMTSEKFGSYVSKVDSHWRNLSREYHDLTYFMKITFPVMENRLVARRGQKWKKDYQLGGDGNVQRRKSMDWTNLLVVIKVLKSSWGNSVKQRSSTM